MYIIWKKRYGGIAKKDPVNYLVDKSTGLAEGDFKRMSLNAAIIAAGI